MPVNSLHSVEFFDLQLQFARKVSSITGIPFAEAVGQFTNIYVRLALGNQFDPANPDWARFVTDLSTARDQAEMTHAAHRGRLHLPVGEPSAAAVGCFSFALSGQHHVRLHFHAGEDLLKSALSDEKQSERQCDLTSLLSILKSTRGGEVCVVGASWLYNLPNYRHLFPAAYLASLQPIKHPYQRLPLWGQFLNRDRSLREEARSRFLPSVAKASNLLELASCFPFSVLATTSPASVLYEHVGL